MHRVADGKEKASEKNEIDFIKTSTTVPKGILHLNGAKKLYCKLTLLKRYFSSISCSLVALLVVKPPHEFSPLSLFIVRRKEKLNEPRLSREIVC